MSRKFMSLRKTIVERGLVKPTHTDEYSENIYVLPVPKEKMTRCGSRRISPAHAGNLNNSVDFYVPEGTEVYAAEDGTVLATKDDSDMGGPDVKYWEDGNYVEIRHGKEFTRYEHLRHKGIAVKVGEMVKAGQVIGYSGNTGLSEEPHLHFEAGRAFGSTPDDYVTLRARFKDFRDVYKE